MTGTSQRGDDVDRVARLLAEATALAGQGRVSLKCETELLETVYIDCDRHGVVVHDGGRTFAYLASGKNRTYVPWSARDAAEECSRQAVGLTDVSDDEDAIGFRIERPVRQGESLATIVEAVSQAVDGVFRRHMRDLQPGRDDVPTG